jgi:hypothetical protein
MSTPIDLLPPLSNRHFGRFFKKQKRRPRKKTKSGKHARIRIKRARFRSRVQANPLAGVSGITTGQFYSESSPGKKDWQPYGSPRNDYPSYPYITAESCADEIHGSAPWLSGGPFRKIFLGPVVPFTMLGSGTYTTSNNWNIFPFFGKVQYRGGFAPPNPFPGSHEAIFDLQESLGKNSSLVPSTSTLETQTWSRTKPPIETGGLAVAVAESRDIPHMLHTSARGFVDIFRATNTISTIEKSQIVMQPKKAADHFLNHNFGWVPFIKDIVAMCDNVVNADRKIEKIMRDNGNDVRRRVTFVNHTENIDLGGDEACLVSPGNTAFLQDCLVAPATYNVALERQIEAHGVGRFRYYIPYFDTSNPEAMGLLGNLRRQIAIHGARISPINVYRSIKWTWLIDWITDSGRTISALNDQLIDNMAATYLFLCHTQKLSYRFNQVLPFNGASGGTKVLSWSRVIEVKQRKEAEAPFGFGLSWEELTPKQLALLASIGISRSGIKLPWAPNMHKP